MTSPLSRPLLLAPDNFTAPARTPWGGRKILERYKADAGVREDRRGGVVGESWELSVTPELPSELAEGGESLRDVLGADPARALGAEAGDGRPNTALLVKLLDAADELSVQIHPADDYPALGPGEAGKPESWYVLEREEGAGLYLGLADGVTRETMAQALAEGGDVSALLTFVPVEPGDFFLIEAGTAHAIGRGVTLVEPQHVRPGRRGVTYRYWDWNRRYDAAGRPDPNGTPRELHVEDALAVTRWDAPRGDALLERIRRRAGAADAAGAPTLMVLASPDGPIPSADLAVARLSGTGALPLADNGSFWGVTVVEGRLVLRHPGGELAVDRGRTAAVPAAVGPMTAELSGCHAVLSAIRGRLFSPRP